MKTAHTKGNWRVSGKNVRSGDALVCSMQDSYFNKPTPHDEMMANVHLIAAAPELLEAVKSMLVCIGDNPKFWAEEKAAVAALKKSGVTNFGKWIAPECA